MTVVFAASYGGPRMCRWRGIVASNRFALVRDSFTTPVKSRPHHALLSFFATVLYALSSRLRIHMNSIWMRKA